MAVGLDSSGGWGWAGDRWDGLDQTVVDQEPVEGNGQGHGSLSSPKCMASLSTSAPLPEEVPAALAITGMK